MTMIVASTSSFPKALRNGGNVNPLQLKASLNDYPLASRIMVRNLPYSTTESALMKKFSKIGQIAEVKLLKDEVTKRSKGFAFVQYTCQDHAILALELMDQEEFDGRMIYVELAKPGKGSFKGYPITTGPPKKRQLPVPLPEHDEVADCWY